MKTTLTLLLLCLLTAACNEGSGYRYEGPVHKYAATGSCSNMGLKAAYLFRGEVIELWRSNELIFSAAADSTEGAALSETFCLPAQDYTLRLRSIYKGRSLIDTTIEAIDATTPYHLDISLPQPLNWQAYYRDTTPGKKPGYLAPDSAVRFVTLIADSMYRNTGLPLP